MIRLHTMLLFCALFLTAWMQAKTDGPMALERVDLDPWPPQSPVLEVTGSCPGPVLVSVTGMTPAGQVVLGASLGREASVILAGSCAGTIVDLSEPQVIAVLNADFLGEAGLVTAVQRSAACGALTLQALDVATCTTTQPVGI